MPNSKITYHCTVSKSNESVVTEFDIILTKVKNNNLLNLFYWLVFVLNVASVLLFVGLIFIVIYFSNKDYTPELNKWLCVFVCSIISVFLIFMLIIYYKARNNNKIKLLPDFNTSFKSFGFYVITVSTIAGVLVSCISTFFTDYDSYTYAKYTIYYISIPFYVLSFIWIICNFMKALKSNETDKDITKLNQIIQFCVSVLTIIGVFIGKIDDYDSEIGFIYIYASALAMFLFAPFVISYCMGKYSNGLQSKS